MVNRQGSLSPSTEKQLVDTHFRAHAARWREMYDEDTVPGAIYRERMAVVLRWVDELAVPLAERILDIGCGAGVSTVALARRGYGIEAVDSVADMLDSTRQNAAAAGVSSFVRTSLGDAHSLAFPDGAFGLVLAIGVIPHLHSPQPALGEMARVLKPGGCLLVTAGNRMRLNHVLDPWLCPALEPAKRVVRTILRSRRLGPPPTARVERLGSLRAFTGWLSAAGLTRVRAQVVGFEPLTFHYRPVFGDRISLRLNRWLQWLADRDVPGIRSSGMDYVVLARKEGGN